ncbi:hypothetical protein OG884_24750 [Streptosporangium sp. NBC_01755]|nr:hypothetical protein [Streptosporangium sp. NBC_01755]WSC98083.1 hypothetical protein OG884_24750 [Streptosporangium sp. NBC_01755]
MAIWAEKAQVFFSVIQPVAIDVVNVQYQCLTLPGALDPTARAAVWHPDLDQAAPELPGVRARAALRSYGENLFRATASW